MTWVCSGLLAFIEAVRMSLRAREIAIRAMTLGVSRVLVCMYCKRSQVFLLNWIRVGNILASLPFLPEIAFKNACGPGLRVIVKLVSPGNVGSKICVEGFIHFCIRGKNDHLVARS